MSISIKEKQVKICIVIPALNERRALNSCIQSILCQSNQFDVEIIVVDGGSTDGTLESMPDGVSILRSHPPVAAQKNVGARATNAEILLFLHADCVVENGALAELIEVMKDPTVAGGTFKLEVLGKQKALNRYLSDSGTWNLGDQGIFCRRSCFERAGGFPQISLYEFVLMKSLRKMGCLVQLKKRCITSAKKFEQNGHLKAILLTSLLRLSYSVGLPSMYLERKYTHLSEKRT